MYTLYHCPTTCSSAVLIALEIAKIEHQIHTVDLQKGEQFSPEFLALNPQAKVPVLVNNQQVMTQGQAILLHLSQCYPEAELMPALDTNQGFEALKWLDFVAGSLHFTFTKLFRADQVGIDINIIKANAEEIVVKLTNQLEKKLQTSRFLAGDKPTLADYYLAVIMGWDKKVLSFRFEQRFPELKRFKADLQATHPHSKTLQSL